MPTLFPTFFLLIRFMGASTAFENLAERRLGSFDGKHLHCATHLRVGSRHDPSEHRNKQVSPFLDGENALLALPLQK